MVEHDGSWITAFSKQFELSKSTHVVKLNCKLDSFQGVDNIRCYENFANEFIGKKFDFIFIDGPLGADMKCFSRIDVLKLLPQCLKDDLVIMMDDAERKKKKNTIREIEMILTANNINYFKGIYRGIKSVVVISSEAWRFSTSM